MWRSVFWPDLDLLEANALRSVGEVGYFSPCLIVEAWYVGVSGTHIRASTTRTFVLGKEELSTQQ
jgi:hypothetical protein